MKPELIEELGQLLVLVAKEEADKQQQLQSQQQQHVQQQQHSMVNGVVPKHEDATPTAADSAAVAFQQTDGKAEGSSSPADVKATEGSDQKPIAVQAGVLIDADGDSVMQEAAKQQEPQQQDGEQHSPDTAAEVHEIVNDAYAAQEAVVLQEFNAILQRIVAQAEKKSSSLAAAAAAAAAQAPLATAASTASADAAEQQFQQQSSLQAAQQLQQQMPQLSMQQQLLQQSQQPRPMVSSASDCRYHVVFSSVLHSGLYSWLSS